MIRSFSFSEASTAFDCFARHAFAYTGHLTNGTVLKSKNVAPILREGRAWGAACAAWHATGEMELAIAAMDVVLDEDAKRQLEFGIYLKDEHTAMRMYLTDMLLDYVGDVDRLVGLTRMEQELILPIPSRGGRRPSSKYRFQCFIDGWWADEYDQPWIVEFKLRADPWDAWLIQLSRQMRWYSWAWAQHSHVKPVGVLVDERRNDLPKAPKLVNPKSKADREFADENGKVPSHDKSQLCRAEAYLLLCNERGVEPSQEALANMRQRKWQQRTPIPFRDDELEESGQELITAAQVIRNLDSGAFHPLRNSKPSNCRGCRYKEVCPAPDDGLVDMLFERVTPKRFRTQDTEGDPVDPQLEVVEPIDLATLPY